MMRRPRTYACESSGFTLAELLVATTLLSIVMAAVYSAFSSTLHIWRAAEVNLHTLQGARTALTLFNTELSCIVGGSEHLFQGEDDELEFFAVVPPMNVDKGEAAQVMWIRYYYSRSKKTLYRQEAQVQEPLPVRPPTEEDPEVERIKLGRKYRFALIPHVKDFEVQYSWLPLKQRRFDEPPEWTDPIVLDQNKEGWGLPQRVSVRLTIEDPNNSEETLSFTEALTFRGPTTPYDKKRLGMESSD